MQSVCLHHHSMETTLIRVVSEILILGSAFTWFETYLHQRTRAVCCSACDTWYSVRFIAGSSTLPSIHIGHISYEWMNEWISEWVSEWVRKRVSERAIERANERMNFIIYILPVKPKDQAQGFILWQSMMFKPWGDDSTDKDVGNSSTSHGVRTWHILAQISQVIFAASRSLNYMAYIALVVTGVVVWWGGHMRSVMPECVLFVSSRSGIVFNPRAGASTDHSQSAKDIDPYFKSQLYVEDPGHQKPVLILPNGLRKPEERAHDRNLNFCRGLVSNPKRLDRQSSMLPLSYYCSLIFGSHVNAMLMTPSLISNLSLDNQLLKLVVLSAVSTRFMRGLPEIGSG